MNDSAYHHGDLRVALLDAAEDDLRRTPDAVPSIRALAARLGVSATAPHAHFRTKSDLMTALAVRGFERLASDLKETRHDTPDLTALAEAYMVFAADNLGLYRLMFATGTRVEYDEKLRQVSRAAYDMLRDTVREVFPEATAIEQKERTLAAWGVVHGLASLAAEGRISADTLDDRSPRNLARLAARLVEGRT
ncbi:TetR-like C-terminal domain-containing protein [Fontisubflavum oceani]|uniref:TetR/AcrR family transcriptional regulator n=1 Tax=Fontisubflavum oceani TaxID=2978973 RepID=UPI0025B5B693|nr:TetR-like C-terminal domain-containing protein [Fontisubflavum oceani]WJY20433.1 TetR-like C-terminal domain-containing protein [Fontisubflavum oceani]WJY20590.1 TetR-like C-terminal domain-containing protein [Fontisubflavum oceani]